MPDLEQIQQDAVELRRRQRWPEITAEQRFLHLAAEVGEVAEALQRHASADSGDDEGGLSAIGSELYDVIWNVCDLANILGISLESAAREKKAMNDDRRWT